METDNKTIKQALIDFKNIMSDIRKRQMLLFHKADRAVVEQKEQEVREKINLQ